MTDKEPMDVAFARLSKSEELNSTSQILVKAATENLSLLASNSTMLQAYSLLMGRITEMAGEITPFPRQDAKKELWSRFHTLLQDVEKLTKEINDLGTK